MAMAGYFEMQSLLEEVDILLSLLGMPSSDYCLDMRKQYWQHIPRGS